MISSTELLAFVRAVELGGFSVAARDLNLSPSAVSKLVSRLEERLAVRLLNRSTRRLNLTAEGATFFTRSKGILEEMRDAEIEVSQLQARPRGLLRITVGVAFGLHQFVPALPRFQALYPDIQIELNVTDRLVDIIKEQTDIAIRTGALRNSALRAHKICDLQRLICAAPAYLSQYGIPQEPRELVRHNCIVLRSGAALHRWPFSGPKGPKVIEVSGSITANNAETVLQLGLMGAGIIRLGDNIVGEEIRKGKLIPLLSDRHLPEPLPLHAVYLHKQHKTTRVSAMLDFLLQQFAHAPWRHSVSVT